MNTEIKPPKPQSGNNFLQVIEGSYRHFDDMNEAERELALASVESFTQPKKTWTTKFIWNDDCQPKRKWYKPSRDFKIFVISFIFGAMAMFGILAWLSVLYS
jgi:hypothetical protein